MRQLFGMSILALSLTAAFHVEANPPGDEKPSAAAKPTAQNDKLPSNAWGAAVIRVGRPTDRLAENKRFYSDGVGFPVIQSFEEHQGFSGVILGAGEALGLHPEALNLEFTTETRGSPGDVKNDDTNFVLYSPDWSKIQQIADRLIKLGYKPVKAHNPWWDNYCSISFEDPDGFRFIMIPKWGDLDPAEYNNYLKGDNCAATPYARYYK